MHTKSFQSYPIFATLWTVALQTPLSIGFSRQECWSVFPFPSPGDLPDPGIEPTSLPSPALAGRFFMTLPSGKPYFILRVKVFVPQLCLTATLWTVVHQAPLSMGFSRQENWSGLPFPSPMHESEKMKVKSLSHVRLFATLWTVDYQAPPSM